MSVKLDWSFVFMILCFGGAIVLHGCAINELNERIEKLEQKP